MRNQLGLAHFRVAVGITDSRVRVRPSGRGIGSAIFEDGLHHPNVKQQASIEFALQTRILFAGRP